MSLVRVITTVAAWPEALEITRRMLDKHLKEDYELIAFIDTPSEPCAFNLWDSNLREKAVLIAEEWCDEAFLVPNEVHEDRRSQFPKTKEKKAHNANTRAADTLQYAWNTAIKDFMGPILLLDSDMFPVADFKVSDYLNQSDISGIQVTSWSKNHKRSVPWIWSGLLFMNPFRMPAKELWSFDCGKVNKVKVDVSGQTNIWMTHGENSDRIKWLRHLPSLTWKLEMLEIEISAALREFILDDDRNFEGKSFCEIYDQKFLHFRAGSNWRLEEPEVVIQRNKRFLSVMTSR